MRIEGHKLFVPRQIADDISGNHYDLSDLGIEGVADTREDSGRWMEYRSTVFRYEDRLWALNYSRGLTEMQDGADEDDGMDMIGDEVLCVAVEAYDVVLTKYKEIKHEN